MPDWSWLRTKSPKQRFMSDHIGNILVCVITTHCFFLFVYFSAIMFIFFMWVELFLGLTFLHPDTIVKDFLFEIHTHIRDTYYARVGCCKGGCWLLNIFYSFQHPDRVRDQYRALRSVSCHRCVRASYRLLSEVLKEVKSALVLFSAQIDSLKGAQCCMHFVVK